MKMKSLPAFFTLFALSFGQIAYCQGVAALHPSPAIATAINPNPEISKPTTVRTLKRFPQMHTGFAIEIAFTTYPMDATNPIFQQFGNVRYDKLPDGGYSYLIMANFSSKESALDFLNNVVKPKAGKAKLIQYDEGTRKVVRE
jgi:hypothetical protein